MYIWKNVATVFLYSLLGVLIFMLITWGYIFVQSNNLVQDRLGELVVVVSDDNCLSEDGGDNSSMAIYDNLLEASQTSWMKFNTVTIDHVTKLQASYNVCDVTNSATKYYNYEDAPQKGAPIKVELTGYVTLPLFFNPSGDQPAGIPVEITKSYVTMGLKHYKSK